MLGPVPVDDEVPDGDERVHGARGDPQRSPGAGGRGCLQYQQVQSQGKSIAYKIEMTFRVRYMVYNRVA